MTASSLFFIVCAIIFVIIIVALTGIYLFRILAQELTWVEDAEAEYDL